jgi:hypothetical protein
MRTTLIACCLALVASQASAGARSIGLSEALEFMAKKFGKEVAEEGVEKVTTRMTQLAAKHGDEVVSTALRKVGPRVGQVATDAGEHSGLALKLLADHGDEALSVAGRPAALNAIAQHGESAAAALIKHGPVGETIVERFALPGAEALVKVTPQNGRRIAMMAATGEMKPELVTVITKHGDTACEFIWRNKKALTVAATLGAFVHDPSGFLDGTNKLVETAADATVKPIIEIPKTVAGEIARNTNWTLLAVIGTAVSIGLGWMRFVHHPRRSHTRRDRCSISHD